MNENKSVLVINAIVNKENMAELQGYLSNVMQLFVKNEGKSVARFKTSEKLTGENSPDMIAIIEFPDADKINNTINGADFVALSEVRARVFLKLDMMICNGM
jgi:uncharacterized protein (DUF1330 family)